MAYGLSEVCVLKLEMGKQRFTNDERQTRTRWAAGGAEAAIRTKTVSDTFIWSSIIESYTLGLYTIISLRGKLKHAWAPTRRHSL